MKRFSYFILMTSFILTTLLTWAQKPTLNKAWNFFYEKNFAKAKEMIDLCAKDDKLKNKASTFLYQGNICLFLSQAEMQKMQKNNTYKTPYSDAPNEAYLAFKKTLELNPKVSATGMLSASDGLSELSVFLLIRGSELIENQNYDTAFITLQRAEECFKMADSTKNAYRGELYYYLGFSQEMLKNNEQAIHYYEIGLNYLPNTPEMSIRLLELYKINQNYDKIKTLLPILELKYKAVPYFYITKIEILLKEDKEKAMTMLQNPPLEVLRDIQSLANISNIYILEEDYEQAEKYLKQALELEPYNFDVNYNMCVCYLNIVRTYMLKVNQLLLTKKKEDEKKSLIIKTKALDNFVLAKQYYQKCKTIDPQNSALENINSAIERQAEVFAK